MLSQMGYANQVIELPESMRTAQEAAEAIGLNEKSLFSSGNRLTLYRLQSVLPPNRDGMRGEQIDSVRDLKMQMGLTSVA